MSSQSIPVNENKTKTLPIYERNILFAGFCVILSSIFFAFVVVCVKKINPSLSKGWLLCARGLIGSLVSLFMLKYTQHTMSQVLSDIYCPLIWLRSILTACQVLSSYVCYYFMSVTASVSLLLTGPMWLMIYQVFFKKTKANLSLWTMVWITIGYSAIFCMYPPTDYAAIIGWIFAIISSISGSITDIMGKELMKKNRSMWSIILFSYLIPGIIGAVWCLYLYNIDTKAFCLPNYSDCFWLFCIGICSMIAHSLYATGLLYGNTALVSSFGYTRIAFGILIAWIFYNISPSYQEMTGVIVIGI